MYLRSICGPHTVGRFMRFGATAAPLEPDLVWVDANTGRTKVRDHSKPVGPCSSAVMVGISYGDIYDTCLMLRDVIPMLRPHPPGCGSLLVDVYDTCMCDICNWHSIGVRR